MKLETIATTAVIDDVSKTVQKLRQLLDELTAA
jgi:hypothetical protein